ncbi:MAG: aspartate ammonia-lyase [Myxococcales bacterium]|nr:aspartate ammonia-lyase [Myxococcales bacterium]
MLRLRKDVAGNAGVLFVAAELSRRGLNALPTIRNTEGVDIIASEPLGGASVGIQVKTNQSGQKKWLLSKKSEELKSPTLFYVLVNLGGLGELPKFHIVPSKVVAKAVRESHEAWRRKPRRDGTAHKDNSLRVFYDVDGKFLDRWDLLGLKLIP